MTFVARFVDGPLQGEDNDRVFIGRDRLDYLWLAPNPVPDSAMGWILVGFAPGLEPEATEAWPGQVRYRRVAEPVNLHDPLTDEPLLLFELAEQ